MTDEQIKAIEARCAAADEGPWKIKHASDQTGECWSYLSVDIVDENLEFIAHARTDIPALLAALKAAHEQRDRAIELLRRANTLFGKPYGGDFDERATVMAAASSFLATLDGQGGAT
jgi:hypothetical protein